MSGPISPDPDIEPWLKDFGVLEGSNANLTKEEVLQRLALVKSLRSSGRGLSARIRSAKKAPTDEASIKFQEVFPKLDSIESDLRTMLIGSGVPAVRPTEGRTSEQDLEFEERVPEVLRLTTSQGSTDGAIGVFISCLFVLMGIMVIPLSLDTFSKPYFISTNKGSSQSILYYATDSLPAIDATFTFAKKVSEHDLWMNKGPFVLFPILFMIAGLVYGWISFCIAGVETIVLSGRDLVVESGFDGIKATRRRRLARSAKGKLEISNYRRASLKGYEPDSIELPLEGGNAIKIGYGSSRYELEENLRIINAYLDHHRVNS